MRSLLIVCVVVCLALLPAVANAAGQVSDATLAQLGLSSMHQMTDTQGVAIRGSGFAKVSGESWSYSSFPGQSWGPAKTMWLYLIRSTDWPWPPAPRFPSRLLARDLPAQRQRRWHRSRLGSRRWSCRLRQVVSVQFPPCERLIAGTAKHDAPRVGRGASSRALRRVPSPACFGRRWSCRLRQVVA